jgi:N-acyl-D-amino-acid deacylase
VLSTVITGATVIDGTGRPRFSTDLALAGDRIARIGDCSAIDAPNRVDARGKILAPGFINTCGFADNSGRSLPPLNSAGAQGITSEIFVDSPGFQREIVQLRDYGRELPDALDEALEAAQRADAPVHIAHLHAEGPHSRANVEHALERIDRARTHGLDVTCDVYPYIATWIELASLLPPAIELAAYDDESIAAAAAMEMTARFGERWHDLMLAEVSSEERYAWCGMRFDEIARQMRVSAARAVIEFARLDGERARAFYFCTDEEAVATILSAGFCTIGTAAPALSFEDERYGLVHPRTFGTFPRVIGRFVRQRRTLTLEEAVHRMTGLAAQVFSLPDCGELRVGARADLLLFDAEQFIDTATYERPVSAPLGLKSVWVAGEAMEGRISCSR